MSKAPKMCQILPLNACAMQGCPRHEPGRWRRAIAMPGARQGWKTEDPDSGLRNMVKLAFPHEDGAVFAWIIRSYRNIHPSIPSRTR